MIKLELKHYQEDERKLLLQINPTINSLVSTSQHTTDYVVVFSSTIHNYLSFLSRMRMCYILISLSICFANIKHMFNYGTRNLRFDKTFHEHTPCSPGRQGEVTKSTGDKNTHGHCEDLYIQII